MRIIKTDAWEVTTSASGKPSTRYGSDVKTLSRVLLKVQDENGNAGWGETSPLPDFTGETAASSAAVLRLAMKKLEETSIDEPAAAVDTLADFSRAPAARAGLEMAMLDLEDQAGGRSLSARLGGEKRSEVRVTRPFGITQIPEALEKGREYFEQGIRTFKLKVGVDPDTDAERVLALRNEFPKDVTMRVDANGGFAASDALRFAEKIRKAGFEYFEQPVAPETENIVDTFREIRKMGVPVVVDESIFSAEDAHRLIDAEAVDGGVIKMIKFGGPVASKKVASVFENAGGFAVIVSTFESYVGKAAGLAIALSIEGEGHAHELGFLPFPADFSDWRHRFDNGKLIYNPGKGHGGWGIPQKLDALAQSAA